jgi:hypothetical protein
MRCTPAARASFMLAGVRLPRKLNILGTATLWRHSGTLAHSAGLSLARGIDHTEAVPLGIGEDDVVRIRGSFVPVDLGCA